MCSKPFDFALPICGTSAPLEVNGVPVTAVSYDSGGKWSILDDLNVPTELVVDAENITSEKLIGNFEVSIAREKTLDRSDLTKLALECETIFKNINSSLQTDIAL